MEIAQRELGAPDRSGLENVPKSFPQIFSQLQIADDLLGLSVSL
jgi:hypothetical protein